MICTETSTDMKKQSESTTEYFSIIFFLFWVLIVSVEFVASLAEWRNKLMSVLRILITSREAVKNNDTQI